MSDEHKFNITATLQNHRWLVEIVQHWIDENKYSCLEHHPDPNLSIMTPNSQLRGMREIVRELNTQIQTAENVVANPYLPFQD